MNARLLHSDNKYMHMCTSLFYTQIIIINNNNDTLLNDWS